MTDVFGRTQGKEADQVQRMKTVAKLLVLLGGLSVLMLGSPHRNKLVSLLKGNVVTEVARNLPENIQLIIHG